MVLRTMTCVIWHLWAFVKVLQPIQTPDIGALIACMSRRNELQALYIGSQSREYRALAARSRIIEILKNNLSYFYKQCFGWGNDEDVF